MNNIFLGQNDPLLNNVNTYRMPDNAISQQIAYQQMYANSQKDWIGELDSAVRKLDPDVVEALTADGEYVALSSELQGMIQDELMSYVKASLNMKTGVVNNVKRQMEIINRARTEKENENRQNMSELNDYMKNYSHLTFDEYRKVKSGDAKPAKRNNKETSNAK